MATFLGMAGPPPDAFQGSDAEADLFRFTPATLQAADAVQGGGGAFTDILQLLAGGALALDALQGVRGIERIQNNTAGNSYALSLALAASALEGRLEIRGGAGIDVVDGSAVTDAALVLSFIAGGGADSMTGGAGNDLFSVQAADGGARRFAGGAGNDVLTTAPLVWTAADRFLGDAGTDRLVLNGAGSVLAGQLAGLQSVEEIQLGTALPLTLALDNAVLAQAGLALTVLGGAGATQNLDASAVTLGAVTYLAGSGAHSFLGGSGDDVYAVAASAARGDLGAGDDTLRLTSRLASGLVVAGGTGLDSVELNVGGAWDLTGLSGFEQVELQAASTLTLGAAPGFRVLGSTGNDVVSLGGPRQTFFGFEGNDLVLLDAADLPGAVLHGGTQTTADVLRLASPGTYDLRRAAITGFERIETLGAPAGTQSTILLGNAPVELLLRHAAAVTLGALAGQTVIGSRRPDTFTLGATGQFVDGGGGSDTIFAALDTLGAGTVIAGGEGSADTLLVFGNGALDLATAALLVDVERLVLSGPTDVTLAASESLFLTGSGGADTIRADGMHLTGSLAGGEDRLVQEVTLLDLPGTGVLGGGSGSDTLVFVDDLGGAGTMTLPTRFVDFEVLDLSGLDLGTFTITGSFAWQVHLGTRRFAVMGGDGNETFFAGSGFSTVQGGAGNDTIVQSAAPLSDQVLNGSFGVDEIRYQATDFDRITTMPTGWVAETVRLAGSHGFFFANALAGLVVLGDPLLGCGIALTGVGQRAEGGAGQDELRITAGLANTLRGGEGADRYVIDQADAAAWAGLGHSLIDTTTAFTLNDIFVTGSGVLSVDLTRHTVQHIDRILVNAAESLALRFTVGDAMLATADANNNGITGDLLVFSSTITLADANLNAGALTGGNAIRFGGGFQGHDTVTGGAGADSIESGGGFDSVLGGGGADTLFGGLGSDTLRGGTGADFIAGGGGGDLIDLTEAAAASDLLFFGSTSDGSVDINDSFSVREATADRIIGFDPASDLIRLSRNGLGLGSGIVSKVGADAAWDIGSAGVFIFESDSAGNDVLSGDNFADIKHLDFAINMDNGNGFGNGAVRTVALIVSNPETAFVRRTALYLWTDSNGDVVIEPNDDVRLLAVFDGFAANALSASQVLIA